MEGVKHRVLLTGASSGIGLGMSKKLLALGHEVYGIGRDFKEVIDHPNFHALTIDLLEESSVRRIQHELSGIRIDVLILNAGVAYYGLVNQIDEAKIHDMVRVNLEVPMALTRAFLPMLIKEKGMVMAISSHSALGPSPYGAMYAATKAGLLSFCESLFVEQRKQGLRVCTIVPDMTATALYRHADFSYDPSFGCVLDVDDVVEAMTYALHARVGTNINQIVIQPQFQRILRKK